MGERPGHSASTLLDLGVRAARSGGAELLRRSGRVTGVGHKSSGTDPVTDADRAGEAAVVAAITAERPHDGLIGEEGAERAGTTRLRWVIDPLDGTVNYLYGRPQVAVSVACEQAHHGRWRALVGVVHDPFRDETFTAVRGGGARLGAEPLSVNEPVQAAGALVATGFSYHAASRARQAAQLGALLPRIRDIRSNGSAALELCWTAMGRTDGYYEDELSRWDWAAGALIASEAGASVSPLGSGVMSAGPTLYRFLRTALAGK